MKLSLVVFFQFAALDLYSFLQFRCTYIPYIYIYVCIDDKRVHIIELSHKWIRVYIIWYTCNMYILSMYKRITVLFTSLCLFSQGSQAGADESFEREGRCQDLGVFLGQSGDGKPMFLFDRLKI